MGGAFSVPFILSCLKGQIVKTHLKFLEVPFMKSRQIYIYIFLFFSFAQWAYAGFFSYLYTLPGDTVYM